MKKIVSVLLLCVLVISLATGCNQNELSMYQISNEVSLLKAYTQSGSITFDYNFDKLLDSSSESYEQDKALMDLINQQIENLNLKTLYFTSSVNQEKNMMESEYYILDNGDKKQTLFNIRFVDQKFYVNFDGLSAIVRPYLIASGEEDPEILGFFKENTGYIEFDLNEILSQGNDLNSTFGPSMQVQQNINLKERQEFLVEIQDLLDNLLEVTFKDFTTELVEKSYDSNLKTDMYSYTLKSDDVVDLGLKFAQYFINHFSEFKGFYFSILENDKFLATMGLTNEEDKAMYVDTVKSAFEMIEVNLDEVKVAVDEAAANENETGQYKAMLKSFIGDSYIKYSLGKKDDDNFHNTLDLSLNFISPEGMGKDFTFDMGMKGKVTQSNSVSVLIPEEFITFETFNDRFPDTIVFNVDYNDYTYTSGLMGSEYSDSNIQIINGKSYIDINSAPGKMAKGIKWSPQYNKPYYVLPDASGTVFIEEFHQNDGAVYVPFGEYRNLGYSVQWDDYFRTITVTTN